MNSAANLDLEASLGADLAVWARESASSQSAMAFARSHSALLFGWRLAGLSLREIAAALTKLGMPMGEKSVGRLLAKMRGDGFAEDGQARAIAEAVSRKLLASAAARAIASLPPTIPNLETGPQESAHRPGIAAPPTSVGRPADPLAPAATQVRAPSPPARPQAKLAVRAAAVIALPELVPIEGEHTDLYDPTEKDRPKSYAEMRRRLFDSSGGPTPGSIVFSDGDRLTVPPAMRADVFSGRVGSWSQFMERVDG